MFRNRFGRKRQNTTNSFSGTERSFENEEEKVHVCSIITSQISYGPQDFNITGGKPQNVWVEPLTHHNSAGKPPEIKVSVKTWTQLHTVRG